ncbi:MAG: fimbrillin family protein, partial [Porphyromonadaceae bacterium]|nr:fimbrillin family protein [Porphyromonadaceae bacterium]
RSLFLGVLAVASLASCSDDKVLGVSPSANGEEITYSVVTNKATRASDLYSNSIQPESFTVYALEDYDAKGRYFYDDIQLQDGVYTGTDTYYWPSHFSLDFYAFNTGTFTYTGTSIEDTKTITYTVPSTVTEQEDLIYAVEPNLTKDSYDGNVPLNFRHALSQIAFKLENSNTHICPLVKGISVHNVYGSGSFTLPTMSTGTNYDGTNTEPTPVEWTLSEDTTHYAIEFDDIYSLLYRSGKVTSKDLTNITDYVMMLIPQISENVVAEETNYKEGPYFTLKCLISNMGDSYDGYLFGDYDEEKQDYIWGDANIPVAINWEAGKKYTYTFKFGTGDDAGVDDDNNPILTPITYTVTVDEFVPETDDEEMDWYPADAD